MSDGPLGSEPARRRPALPGEPASRPNGCRPPLPRAHSALAAGRQTKPFSRPRSHWDATPLPSLGTQGPLNATTSVLPASRGAGSEDHFGRSRRFLFCLPGPGTGKPDPIRLRRSSAPLKVTALGPQLLNLFFQLPYRD